MDKMKVPVEFRRAVERAKLRSAWSVPSEAALREFFKDDQEAIQSMLEQGRRTQASADLLIEVALPDAFEGRKTRARRLKGSLKAGKVISDAASAKHAKIRAAARRMSEDARTEPREIAGKLARRFSMSASQIRRILQKQYPRGL